MLTSDGVAGLAFQSTRPARGATCRRRRARATRRVSIHAPRTGRDDAHSNPQLRSGCFNPRAPHGARPPTPMHVISASRFQSTRPARGATSASIIWAMVRPGFNPRAPHGARHPVVAVSALDLPVSIHAPRTERDRAPCGVPWAPACFNPRAPHGARRHLRLVLLLDPLVSIHAPRTGRDGLSSRRARRCPCRFNPRAPHGARQVGDASWTGNMRFQSTRPARGATLDVWTQFIGTTCFNPRAPHGARLGRGVRGSCTY